MFTFPFTLHKPSSEGGGGGSWTPAQLTTLAWWDGADTDTILDDGDGTVNQWNDKSGNGYHATQGDGTQQPTTGTRTQNGLNVLDFGGGDRLAMPTALKTVSNNLKWFCVAEVDTSASALLYFSNGVNRRSGADVNRTATGSVEFRQGGVTYNLSATQAVPPTIYGYISNDQAYTDGVARGGVTSVNETVTDAFIGARGTADRLDGSMCELILMTDSLSTENRQRIEGYLAHKWGLTGNLDSGHPYKTDAPLA